MQNFTLLKKLGELKRPVLLKRGISATLEEWLMAAEYLLAEGNPNVILCERGVRTFNNHSRNTLDLNVVPAGAEDNALAGARGSIAWCGKARPGEAPRATPASPPALTGLMMEVHTHPDTAYSDAHQTIDVETFEGIVKDASILNQLEGLFEPVVVAKK